MKLAIITDIHYGIRSDYIPYLENNRRFFGDVFFPALEARGVSAIICLGDLLDRRKYVNYLTAKYLLEDFIIPAKKDYEFHWVIGNHDIFYRDSCSVNAASIFNKGGMFIYDQATEVLFNGTAILFIPWLTSENKDDAFKKILASRAKIAMGHLSLLGFEKQRGVINYDEGFSADYLNKFDLVFSGHFHQKQSQGHIQYLGAFAEFTWADYKEERGFYIFDTETYDLEFIPNPNSVFRKVYYDDAKGHPRLPEGGFESLAHKVVKVIISGKNDPVQYDHFISQIEATGPLDVQVVQDHLNLHLTGDNEIVSEAKDTLDIIRDYVKQANGIVNPTKLDSLIIELYNEAQVGSE